MIEKIFKPVKISKENFANYGDLISTNNVKPIDINNGYAKRFDNLANINTSKDQGKTIVSIFSALKRNFPMKIDMMEKHPLGSQAFIPMKETIFLAFVAPPGNTPEINNIQSFIMSPKMGINYKPGVWHFPLISTENVNFLVIDRKGKDNNLIIHKFNKEKIIGENIDETKVILTSY
jgi:ureidoglycolate lyase